MIIEIMMIRCLMQTGSCLPQDLEREVSSHAQVTKENSLKNKKVNKLLELWTLWLKNMKKNSEYKRVVIQKPSKSVTYQKCDHQNILIYTETLILDVLELPLLFCLSPSHILVTLLFSFLLLLFIGRNSYA